MLDQLMPVAASLLEGGLIALWLAPALVGLGVFLATQHHSRRRRRRVHAALSLVAFGYVVALAAIALWPWDLQASGDPIRDGNWLPWRGSIGYLFDSDPIRSYLGERQILSHLLLMAPLGVLLPIAFGGNRGVVVIFVLAILAAGVQLTAGLAGTERVLDVDDALAGLAGGVGAAAATNAIHVVERLGRLATR